MSAGIKTDNIATNWLIDRISNSATKNPETGKMEAGLFEGLTGSLFGLDTDLIGRTKETNINNQAANNLLEANGLTRSELGIGENANITTGLVGSKTRAYNEQKLTEKEEKQRGYVTSDRDAGFAQQSLLGRQQIDASNNQFLAQQKSQDARYAHTDKQNRLDRGLERELASNNQSMQLALGQMNADLADKRMEYDRETRRMDKRTAAIAQLMSGLGSLGGAFAL